MDPKTEENVKYDSFRKTLSQIYNSESKRAFAIDHADELRAEELKAIEEKVEKATSDKERAQLFREALLEQQAKIGVLTKQGEKDLVSVTPIKHCIDGEIYVEEPVMDETGKVTYKRR